MTEITPTLGLSAYFLGRRIAGQRRKRERVPVAYLYNGVRLPGLPEWDRVAYPYAVIVHGNSIYGLYCSTEPAYCKSGSLINKGGVYAPYLYFGHYDTKGWVGGNVVNTSDMTFMVDKPIWSNHDMIDVASANGTVGLAASEPVPIYE